MCEARKHLLQSRTWVIKLGSALLTNDGCGLKTDTLAVWVRQIMQLKAKGMGLVLVSSGAVAEGISRLGWTQRPGALHELQAAAATGQMGLIQAYESCFQKYDTHTAQVLLTHDDISNRQRYLNARSTLRTLLHLGIVPVVNENDTVATEEIRFGDNDSLAGLVVNLIEADLLVVLTDQSGLYDSDPRTNTQASLITSAMAGDADLTACAGSGSALGRGGMLTKLQAAETAARSGAHTVIASGLEENVLLRIAAGEVLGTLLTAGQAPIAARKRWLANHRHVRGQVVLDKGAGRVLQEHGKSLLAVGVTEVRGAFKRGEIIGCLNCAGVEIARGLVNYSADETRLIQGQSSDRIAALLGYQDEAELIHRDNLILL